MYQSTARGLETFETGFDLAVEPVFDSFKEEK